MPHAPALTVLGRMSERPSALLTSSFDGVDVLEIVAPDPQSASLLREHAAPTFPVEVAAGSPVIVRFRRPPAGGD